MSRRDSWGAASSIMFELPVSGQDYYAWLTEAARRMSIPFRRHYRTQKARNGRGFWLIEDMCEFGSGRGPLVWVEVAEGSTDELTKFVLTPCSDVVSLVTLKRLAQESIAELAELCAEGESPGDSLVPAEPEPGNHRSGRGGARRLEDREDWPKRREIARRWVEAWKSGRTTQEAAAHLEGYDADTLREWARRAGFIE